MFVLLFKSFQVPKEYEGKVLEYGILSAAVLRAVFIRAWPPSRLPLPSTHPRPQ